MDKLSQERDRIYMQHLISPIEKQIDYKTLDRPQERRIASHLADRV